MFHELSPQGAMVYKEYYLDISYNLDDSIKNKQKKNPSRFMEITPW